jgi:hypothetical protein
MSIHELRGEVSALVENGVLQISMPNQRLPNDSVSAPFIMERIGKVSESDRSFDIEFWQRQGSTAIFAAAWEMVVEAYRFKNRESELSFQRTVENIQRPGS